MVFTRRYRIGDKTVLKRRKHNEKENFGDINDTLSSGFDNLCFCSILWPRAIDSARSGLWDRSRRRVRLWDGTGDDGAGLGRRLWDGAGDDGTRYGPG